ncbi:MAG TPA: antibiotic biosynthesis monooxygenase [Cytophagales bacterium]|nr:antibiotic biosynthesis monooxygenase [Cytophagales bacterium]
MFTTIVHIFVKPEYITEFIKATQANHQSSIKEDGNFRFDVLQDANDPSKFVLYESYATEEAVVKHKETPHYLLWRDTVAPYMAKPREGVKHITLFPKVN